MASCPVSPLGTTAGSNPVYDRGDALVFCSKKHNSRACSSCLAYSTGKGSHYAKPQALLSSRTILSTLSCSPCRQDSSFLQYSVSPTFGSLAPGKETEQLVMLGTYRTRAAPDLPPSRNPTYAGALSTAVRRNRCLLSAPFSSNGMYRNHRSSRWMLAAANITATWGPFLEQLILFSTVALAYAAGVATPARNSIQLPLFPHPKPSRRTFQEKEKEINLNKLESASLTGSVDERSFVWEEVWRKFDKKLSKVIASMEMAEFDGEGPTQSPVLTLQAMAKGPRLRLLRATSQHLCREVKALPETSQYLESASWLKLSIDTLCNLVVPVCQYWLSQELTYDITDQEGQIPREAGSQAMLDAAKILADNAEGGNLGAPFVLDYFLSNGKAALYADFLYFLRFRTVRTGSICSFRAFVRFAEYLFEDLVISVADAATEIYVNRSSADITGLDSGDWPALLRPSLSSTRSLERFRNEVALRSWLRRNFASVEAMYEDRFELWTLQGSLSMSNQAHKGKSKGLAPDSSKDLVLTRWKLPARRSKELKALSGWRYNYSLYLEFSDIVGPLLRALLTKLGDAISFLLVRLIGRSLGLIYRGVRQSVKWSP